MDTRVKGILAGLVVLALVVAGGCPDESEPEAISEMGPDVMDESETMPPPDIADEPEDVEGVMSITSPAFEDGETIPVKYTADGENMSPPLQFADVPGEAEALALVMHDPDAPMEGGFTHWVVYDMPPMLAELPEDIPGEPQVEEPELTQGLNSAEQTGYTGPAPPEGDDAHRYEFTLFALSEELDLDPGATKDDLAAAMAGNILEEATLTGMYDR
jgi:hypothetical protein